MATKIEFFISGQPPRATAQMQKIAVRHGRPIIYDPPRVKAMKAELWAGVFPHRPDKPMEGPVRLSVDWSWSGKAPGYKLTRPDLDNLQKALKDQMTKAGFWHDDAQIVWEVARKYWGCEPGIHVTVGTP
jgi:crossover junction endodeoxyribonuclease RusA